MSRTRRFYNRPSFGTWARFSMKDSLFHPYAVRCMGHCHSCRNPNQDQRRIRKARARDLWQLIRQEIEALRRAWDMEDSMYCALGAETSLARDWLTPEEDAAWGYLA